MVARAGTSRDRLVYDALKDIVYLAGMLIRGKIPWESKAVFQQYVCRSFR